MEYAAPALLLLVPFLVVQRLIDEQAPERSIIAAAIAVPLLVTFATA
ncbi:hypothetical protein [Ralstonia sp. 1138]